MPRRRPMLGLAALTVLAAGTAVVLARAPGTQVPGVVGVGRGPASIAIDGTTRRVFVLNATDATVSVLDASTTAIVGTVSIGRGPLGNGAIAVDERAASVLVTKGMPNDDTVTMLDAATGDVRRTVHSGVYGAGPFALDDRAGLAFVANGVVGVLDVRTGAVHLAPPGKIGVVATSLPLAVDRRTGRVFLVNDAALTPIVIVFDVWSGAVVRTLRIGVRPSPGIAVVVDERTGLAFVASQVDNSVSVLDERTGQLINTMTPQHLLTDMLVDEASGLLFVAAGTIGSGGPVQVRIFDPMTGVARRTVTLGAPIEALALDRRRDRVYVLTSNDVRVLDGRTGAALCAIARRTAPIDSSTVAVDERTGSLWVVNPDYLRPASDPWVWLPAGLRRQLPFIPPPPPPPQSLRDLRQPPGTVTVLDPRCPRQHT